MGKNRVGKVIMKIFRGTKPQNLTVTGSPSHFQHLPSENLNENYSANYVPTIPSKTYEDLRESKKSTRHRRAKSMSDLKKLQPEEQLTSPEDQFTLDTQLMPESSVFIDDDYEDRVHENLERAEDKKPGQGKNGLPPSYDEATPVKVQPQITEEYSRLFTNDRALQDHKPIPNNSFSSEGVEIIAYSTSILSKIQTLQNDISEIQAKLIQDNISKGQATLKDTIQDIQLNGPKKILPKITKIVKNKSNVKQILELSQLKQSLATNQIMLVFQQQAELLQEQVNPALQAYVKYNSAEKKLIAQINQQAKQLYNKTEQLDERIMAGTNQKRADKLVNSDLLDTKFSGLTSDLRPRDAGFKLDKVNPHYSLADLKVILKQFQNANKEMNGLLKMPDVSQRCGFLAALYDCTTALATRTAFLIPQTVVAAVSIVEYGISTVLVDTVKQGWTAGKNAGDAVWEKRNAFVTKTINKRDDAIFKSINKNREEANKLMKDFIEKADAIINNQENQQIKKVYQMIYSMKLANTTIVSQVLELFKEANLDLHQLPHIKQLENLEKQIEELDAQLEKVKDTPFTKLATAILGVPAAVIWGGFSGVGKTIVAGAKNLTVNVPSGIAKNYNAKTTGKIKFIDKDGVEVESEVKSAFTKGLSTIHNRDRNARDAVHKEKAEAATAKKILSDEVNSKTTRSSEFELPEAEGVAFVRQERWLQLQDYIKQTEASIEAKEAQLANRIGGVANLIQSTTPESYIKNTVLAKDQGLLKDVVDLAKLKQQNAVSNIMLAFLKKAEHLEQQVYPDNSQEQKINEEIQDLALSLAEKASVLNEKIDAEISGKRADKLEKNTLVEELSKIKIDPKSVRRIMQSFSSADYDLNYLKSIKKVFQKANEQVDALSEEPDVSKRCGFLAALYDCTTALATRTAFLIPQTAVAAVSIVEYAIMTVVVDTVKQGLTSAKNAGEDVWKARGQFISNLLFKRVKPILSFEQGNIKFKQQLKKEFLAKTDEIMENARLRPSKAQSLKNQYQTLKEKGDLLVIQQFLDTNNLLVAQSVDTLNNIRYQIANLEDQQRTLEKELKKAASAPYTELATAIAGVPAAVLWGGLSGVGKTIVAGVKNVTKNVAPGIAKNYENKTTVEGVKKFWARNLGEVHSEDPKARDESYKNKAKTSLGARELKRRVDAKNKGQSHTISY